MIKKQEISFLGHIMGVECRNKQTDNLFHLKAYTE